MDLTSFWSIFHSGSCTDAFPW